MALTIGKVGPFDEELETKELYTEQLGQYFIANDVHQDLNDPSLLSSIWPIHYTLLERFVGAKKNIQCHLMNSL